MEAKKALRSVRLKVAPEEYFQDWSYDIIPAHWETLGVRRTKWVDPEKSAPKRARIKEQLLLEGVEPQKAHKLSMSRGTLHCFGWSQYEIKPEYFAEGYSFISKEKPWQIQIHSQKEGILIFYRYDKSISRYNGVFSAKSQHFIRYLKTHDERLLADYDPRLLPESDLKYLLIKSISSMQLMGDL